MPQETLSFIVRQDHVLLGRHFAGPYRGRYYGLGAVTAEKETPTEAIIRAASAIYGVDVLAKHVRPMGELVYHQAGQADRQIAIFLVFDPTGQPRRHPTIWPTWYAVKHPPYGMMPDDHAYWLSHVLRRQAVHGELWFNGNGHMVKHQLTFGHQKGGAV